MPLFAIAIGGALGALLRFWVADGIHAVLGRSFPYGTLTVNLLGSLLMGGLYVLFADKLDLNPAWRAGLLVGVLGAFTTFSTFSLETLLLLEQGRVLTALLNALISVTGCVAATALGYWLMRAL